jgi:hypothetical protein
MRPRSSVVEREIPALWCILKAIRSIRVGVKNIFIFSSICLSDSLFYGFCSENGSSAVGLGWTLNSVSLTTLFFSRGTAHGTLTGTFETRPHLST